MFQDFKLRSREEAERELAASCGRFMNPYRNEEKLRASIVERIARIDVLRDSQIIVGSGMPLNWQWLLEFLYDRRVLARARFEPIHSSNDFPAIPEFALRFDRSSRPSDGSATGSIGSGASLDREAAMSKAVGETLERYFLSTYSQKELLRASSDEMRHKKYRIPDVMDFPGFLPFQRERFPDLGVIADTKLSWIEGEEYPSGKRIMLPAQCVFWNFKYTDAQGIPFEQTLIRSTTSGCAGHFSKDEAILAGILENIQRDAFLIYWLNSLSPKVLDVASFPDPDLQEFLSYLARYGIEAKFLNTTSDIGIPTVTCALIDRRAGEPIIAIGASTGFEARELLLHSAVEATLVLVYAHSLEPFRLPEKYEPFLVPKIHRPERLSLWRGENMLERFSFFLTGEAQSVAAWMGDAGSVSGTEAQLTYVLDRLRALGKGHEVYVYEVRDALLRDLNYHVVRTIVPKLMPLYLLEHVAPLASSRLKEVPEKLGYEPAATYNPWPHPFP